MPCYSELAICETCFQGCELDEASLVFGVEPTPPTVDRDVLGVKFTISLRVELTINALVRYEVISANIGQHQSRYVTKEQHFTR